MRRFASVACGVAAFSTTVWVAPAHAVTEDRGQNYYAFYDQNGVAHDLTTWLRIDYTNRYIRPYARHSTATAMYKTTLVTLTRNGYIQGESRGSGEVQSLTVTLPSAQACNGAARWFAWGDYGFYTGPTYREVSHDSHAVDSAC